MGEYDFRTKSVTVQAVRFTGENWLEIGRFCGATLNDATDGEPYKMTGGAWNVSVRRVPLPAGLGTHLLVDTLKGEIPCMAGDWLIRGTMGEFYPVNTEVFEAKYERIATIAQPEHVIVFGADVKPNMHHPQGCDVGTCEFTAASMRIPLPMLAMHGSWTCDVVPIMQAERSEPFPSTLILKDKIA